MPRASRDKKRRQSRSAQAKIHRAPKRRARTPKSTPLNAQRDAERKQEVQRRRRENSEQVPNNTTIALFAGRELFELMNRRTAALVELPMRMARCRHPFELWNEQTRFMQGLLSDYQSLARRMMTNAVDALPTLRTTRVT